VIDLWPLGIDGVRESKAANFAFPKYDNKEMEISSQKMPYLS